MSISSKVTGGCLCGAVRYEVNGPQRAVVNCHCSQCRRTSGHFVAATACRRADLQLIQSGGLQWYQSSARARRGFCNVCGSSLFWEETPDGKPADGPDATISVMAGTLDGKTGLETAVEICVEDAGDYYRRDERVRQVEGWRYEI